MRPVNRLPVSIIMGLSVGGLMLTAGAVLFSLRLASYGFNPVAIVAFWLLVPLTAGLMLKLVLPSPPQDIDGGQR
jgi:hypothetical protein